MGYTKVGAGGPSAHAQPPADHAAPSPGKRNTGHTRRMLTCPCRQRRQIAAATHTTEAICGPGPEDACASTPRPLPTPVLVILQGVRYSLLATVSPPAPKAIQQARTYRQGEANHEAVSRADSTPEVANGGPLWRQMAPSQKRGIYYRGLCRAEKQCCKTLSRGTSGPPAAP